MQAISSGNFNSSKSKKDRQYIDQKKYKYKRTHNNVQSTLQKTKNRATRNPLKTRGDSLCCYRKASEQFPTTVNLKCYLYTIISSCLVLARGVVVNTATKISNLVHTNRFWNNPFSHCIVYPPDLRILITPLYLQTRLIKYIHYWNLQFLTMYFLSKLRFSSLGYRCP
jgi:hypothetical protein